MQKQYKSMLAVLIVLAVLVGMVVLVLGLFKEPEVEELVLPGGNLSNSLFDSQNSSYQGQSAFPQTYTFADIPYTVDTVDADGAVVESSIIYPTADGYYFFYSEVTGSEGMSNCIARQFAKVLNYDFNQQSVMVETMSAETGFVNGFGAEYQIVHVRVPGTDGKDRDAYMPAYRLDIQETEGISATADYDIIIGVAVESLSTDSLAAAKALLDADTLTIQYSDSLARDLAEAEEKALKAAAAEQEAALKEAEKNAESGAVSGDAETATAGSSASSLSPVTDQEKAAVSASGDGETSVTGETKSMGILLKKDYEDLVIHVNWTNVGATPSSITISDASGMTVYTPDEVSGGTASFDIGSAASGVYLVAITGWEECGTFTSELLH